jgi:glycosyltransferase involved in cell wall biosynthesis
MFLEIIPNDFNDELYLKLNPDVVDHFSSNPKLHYIKYGYLENRKYKIDLPDNFNGETYLKLNPDIKEQYLNNPSEHYQKYGNFENRKYKVDIPSDFDEKIYFMLNPDIKDKSITPTEHYVNYGYFENRPYTNNVYHKYYSYRNKEFIKHKISVILPSYNNEEFLNDRLTTIYNQTYPPHEVIIIDDASTDNSVLVIQNYIDKYPNIKSKLIINPKNLGSGYYNWIEGIKLATGDLIWIAESDDYCKLDFIEVLNNCFNNKSVSIAYSNNIFIDSNKKEIWTLEKYLNNKWSTNFITSTIKLVKEEWGCNNIIPNVSSCIFKKPSFKILDQILEYLKNDNIKLVIDWIFYLLLAKCGSIAYTIDTTSYYRQHNNSVSHNISKDQFVYEHYKICEFILENFDTNKDNIKKIYNKILDNFVFDECITEIINNVFNVRYLIEIYNKNKNNFKNILICNYSFSSGGGEIFPIFLANEMYNKNINVFFLSKEEELSQPSIVKILNKNICIFNDVKNINIIIDDFKINYVNTHHILCDHDIIQYKANYNNLNLNHIITDHGNYCHYYDSNKYVFSKIENIPTKFVYIIDKNKNNFITLSDNKNIQLKKIPICIPNYDINEDIVTRENYGLTNSNFVITLVSRPLPEKGWEEMIQIVIKLNIVYKNNIYLLIVGDINNTFAANLIEKYKVFNNIKFLGYQSQVKKIFYISDIGVLPSYYACESSPLVLIECLFANKPFITSNIGDVKNIMYGKNDYAGSVIDLKNTYIDDIEYMSEIQKYINSAEYYSKKVDQIEYVLEKFSFTKIINEYLNFFDDIN